jgi:hypothetical protein
MQCWSAAAHLLQVSLLLLPPCHIFQPAEPDSGHPPLLTNGSDDVLDVGVTLALLRPLHNATHKLVSATRTWLVQHYGISCSQQTND